MWKRDRSDFRCSRGLNLGQGVQGWETDSVALKGRIVVI